jgi:hypothetical protein
MRKRKTKYFPSVYVFGRPEDMLRSDEVAAKLEAIGPHDAVKLQLANGTVYLVCPEEAPARRRKADLYVLKLTRWLAGGYAEETQRDLQDRVEKWRAHGLSEGQIVRQLRWELFWILFGTIGRAIFRVIPTIWKLFSRS